MANPVITELADRSRRQKSSIEALADRVVDLELERAELLAALEMLASRSRNLLVETLGSLESACRLDCTLSGTVEPLIYRIREKRG